MDEHIVAQRWSWLLVLGILTAAFGWLSWQLQVMEAQTESEQLQVHVLDVGQGSATLVVTPDGYQVLIDGGAGPQILRQLSQQLPWYDRSLDLVIATHPDSDHVGGLVDVLERYEVERVIWSGQGSDGPAADAFVVAVEEESGVQVTRAGAGQVWQVGASTTLRVFAPAYRPQRIPTNAGSVVLQLRYGETSLLLTGDVPKSVERYLVDWYGTALASTLLLLGHHGSDTSTDQEFLATVQPAVAAVSVGQDNSFGHPAPEVVARVEEYDIPLFSTATHGTITFVSDGQRMWQE